MNEGPSSLTASTLTGSTQSTGSPARVESPAFPPWYFWTVSLLLLWIEPREDCIADTWAGKGGLSIWDIWKIKPLQVILRTFGKNRIKLRGQLAYAVNNLLPLSFPRIQTLKDWTPHILLKQAASAVFQPFVTVATEGDVHLSASLPSILTFQHQMLAGWASAHLLCCQVVTWLNGHSPRNYQFPLSTKFPGTLNSPPF